MRNARFATVALLALPLLGCPVMHQSPGARAQEAANELNVNSRFGRMELASENVSPKAKDAFLEHRRGWGAKIRVADYELGGIKLAKNEEEADVWVKVAWYRVDEGDLHQTTLKQKWKDVKGAWLLVEESRSDGDLGLIGDEPARAADAATASAKNAPPRNVQFPTIRLGGGEAPLETLDSAPPATTTITSGSTPASAPTKPAR